MTISGLTFVLGTAALFIWGCWLGYRGLMADHEPWLSFGHAPGDPARFDAHHAGGRAHAA
jgi:hypothetical protein